MGTPRAPILCGWSRGRSHGHMNPPPMSATPPLPIDDDARAADALQEFEAKVAALEQLVGRQALEIEFLKRAVRSARLPSGAPISAITGPPASPSRGGVR